jgi:hypothetical protein
MDESANQRVVRRTLMPCQDYDKLFAGLEEPPKKKVKAQFFLKNLFSFQKVTNPLLYGLS